MHNCGGRHFCPGCGEELIHRDHRRPWESASAFGQIVSRMGPTKLTTGDIDHYSTVFGLHGADLLRIIEHKQPDQALKPMQEKVLLLLGTIIQHALDCDDFAHALDQRTGVFLIRGVVTAEPDGRRATFFDGPHAVLRANGNGFEEVGILEDAEDIFRWLEGTKKPGPRRNRTLLSVAQEDDT